MNARPRFGLMTLALLAALLLSGFFAARQVQASPREDDGIGMFYEALAPHGNWVTHPVYGLVWSPRDVAEDWRPYTDGYWAHTREYGWLWVSYEPWGWAVFHYGRWAWDNGYGWIWVPGRVWAPAWVFWRWGGGYAAWAPMPPNVLWQPGIGLNIAYFNYDRDMSWDSWVTVREYDLPRQHINRHVFSPRENRPIINGTHHGHHMAWINNTIVNRGVPVEEIERITRHPVISRVPEVHDRMDINSEVLCIQQPCRPVHDRGINRTGRHEGQPAMVQLPMVGPMHGEIRHNEESARRPDRKKPDGTRVSDHLEPSGHDESRAAGRMTGGMPAPVQAPYVMPEQPNPLPMEPVGQTLSQPAIPETPLIGLDLDPGAQRQETEAGRHHRMRTHGQPADRQSSTITPPAPAQTDGGSVPVPATEPSPAATDVAPLPSLESARQPSDQTLQTPPVADQRQPAENLQRQQQIDRLQEELAHGQEKQKQQEAARQQEQQSQQAQQQEAARQQEQQSQQVQQQEAARQQEQQSQQVQQQEAARQQEQQSQQVQQQEAARQQEQQSQQAQQQEAERQQEQQSQQAQQQEAARQQEQQSQQVQQQEAARQQEQQSQQVQQQEAARQQEQQSQQVQQQEAARQQEQQSQQAQQQEAARQQEQQNQQAQQQEAARQQEQQSQQAQQQEAARQQEQQNQQAQQQEAARQQEQQNQQAQQQQQEAARQQEQQNQQAQQQEAARQQSMQNQQQQQPPPQPQQQQPVERAKEESHPAEQQEAPH